MSQPRCKAEKSCCFLKHHNDITTTSRQQRTSFQKKNIYMAPIRRYLRITKYSVLECRIYLDNPALAESWLLKSRNPILPRVIEKIRPLVLPKLREENERSRGKGGNKKKGVKDVVVDGRYSSQRMRSALTDWCRGF